MKVKFFATFRDIVHLKELEINIDSSESQTVDKLLDDIIKKFPTLQKELFNEDGTVKKLSHILVNGRNIIYLKGLQTELKASDEIALIPPVGGG